MIHRNFLLTSILLVKYAFLVSLFLYHKDKREHDYHEAEKWRYRKICCHIVFLFLMGLLLIDIFRTGSSKEIWVGKKEAFYLYFFGLTCILESSQYIYLYFMWFNCIWFMIFMIFKIFFIFFDFYYF